MELLLFSFIPIALVVVGIFLLQNIDIDDVVKELKTDVNNCYYQKGIQYHRNGIVHVGHYYP